MRMGLKFNRIISQVKHEMPSRILLCLKKVSRSSDTSADGNSVQEARVHHHTFENIILQHLYTQVRASMIRCLEAILRCINILSI